MKKLFGLLLFFIINFSLCAEAPELKNILPNSWEKILKISAKEEIDILQQNVKEIEKIKQHFERYIIFFTPLNCINIYKQTVGEDIFYRLIFTEKQNPDFSLPDCKFVQVLIYNNKIAAVGSYNIKMNISLVNYEQKLYALFYSIDIVEVSQKAIGIMLSRVAVPVNKDSNFTGIQNNQPYGEVELSYLEMSQLKDIDFKAAYEGYGIACFPYDNALSVYASPCLVDNSIPLKYGLQNAFDHNHSTSYVENTKDDLINIYFFKNGPELFTISAFAVINGYAQNSTLYYNNNRVKKIGSTTKFNGSWDNFRIMELKNNYIERELAEITDYPEHLTYTIKKIGHLNPMLIHICNM